MEDANRDWRKCQEHVKALRACMQAQQKRDPKKK